MTMQLKEPGSQWYVAYTNSRAERMAKKKLDNLGIKNFLPLQKVVRQWSDRKKKLEVPLFPNYIFINTKPTYKFKALALPELISYVYFDKKPVTVPEKVVESLEKVLLGDVEVTNESFENKIGSKVRITEGKFAGAEGKWMKTKNRARLIIRVEVLNQTVTLDVSSESVEAI